ncbi:unnamed protein product [Eruca vesicaria subsp. sativa]|uniref:Uncharacterized protein n=1 Tax=Eruca vesicaria subsp. sativa TaxID=29727 RepID=A0ABC8M1R7_ERUVS|nr:unnamed protein product [Eruca vesicaria subsp. sativa]
MAANAWTIEENEELKNAVQWYPAYLPNRFECIARCLGKSVVDVMKHYQDMVDDLLETRTSPIDFPYWMIYGIKPSWDKEEHEHFLNGLAKYGRGDWKHISRKSVMTRTPMQVASHAQKYFLRQDVEEKAKKRSSIHNITLIDHAANNVNTPQSDLEYSTLGQPPSDQ